MINIKPKTYNEIVRMKKCYILTQYFSNITEDVFNEIYNFLGENSANTIIANQNVLSFVNAATQVVKSIALVPKNSSFDSIKINQSGISVVPHYSSSTSSSWEGSSSNNNNNNNNNNQPQQAQQSQSTQKPPSSLPANLESIEHF